jgi:flagellar basal body-associated protein FliL
MVEFNRTKENSKKSKKFLSVPILTLVILSLVLVSAAIVYLAFTHSFTKTINVFAPESSSEYVTISGAGDLGSSVINCENQGAGCSVNNYKLSCLKTK